jgi:hypothetical protein
MTPRVGQTVQVIGLAGEWHVASTDERTSMLIALDSPDRKVIVGRRDWPHILPLQGEELEPWEEVA